MAKPQAARIICGQCDAWYYSEGELLNHIQTSHRRYDLEKSTFRRGGALPDSLEERLGTLGEEWTRLSLQLRNKLQARFDHNELDTIDRFILVASHCSVFDEVVFSRDSQSLLTEKTNNR
jgi:hypothetical protein